MTFSTQNAHHLLNPQNPPNQETQIFQYLAIQIQIEILKKFDCAPKNLTFWVWWISGV